MTFGITVSMSITFTGNYISMTRTN